MNPEISQGGEIQRPTKSQLIAERENAITLLEAAQTPGQIREAITTMYTPKDGDRKGYTPEGPDSDMERLKQSIIASSREVLHDLNTKGDLSLGTRPE